MSKADLKELFGGLQSQMAAQLNTNRKHITHPGSVGDALENVWIEWLRKYLPNRYCVDKAIGRFQVSSAIFWLINLPFYCPNFCTKFSNYLV